MGFIQSFKSALEGFRLAFRTMKCLLPSLLIYILIIIIIILFFPKTQFYELCWHLKNKSITNVQIITENLSNGTKL